MISQLLLQRMMITKLLVAVALLLLAGSVIGQLLLYQFGFKSLEPITKLFYVGREDSFPTHFSVLLLALVALLLGVIAILSGHRHQRDVFHWWVLTLGFLVMGIDENSSVHERLNRPIGGLLGEQNAGMLYFAWIIPGIVLALGIGLFFLRFLFRLPRKTRLTFIIAAAFYLGGAIGCEMIEGPYVEVHGLYNFSYSMIITVEEGLEMAGIIIFIHALLGYLADHFSPIELMVTR